MTEQEITDLAAEYLDTEEIHYVKPGKIRKLESNSTAYLSSEEIIKADENTYEVIFLKPEALNPDIVTDPPDERELINIKTKLASLIYQM